MNKKSKTTKKALLLSAGSLMLSCAMLVGTTFAWFTDSVTTGRNSIVAGNLDVHLEYWGGESPLDTGADATWNDVEENTDLFKDVLWEPGAMYAYTFRVSNAGNLALQYEMNLKKLAENALKESAEEGTEHSLSEVIKVAFLDVELKEASTEEKFNAADAVHTQLPEKESARKTYLEKIKVPKEEEEMDGGSYVTEFAPLDKASKKGKLLPMPEVDAQGSVVKPEESEDNDRHISNETFFGKEEPERKNNWCDAFTMVLYWAPNDDETDNKYNVNNKDVEEDLLVSAKPLNGYALEDDEPENALFIDLGVNLFATQVEYEKDSFDEKYDANAMAQHRVAEAVVEGFGTLNGIFEKNNQIKGVSVGAMAYNEENNRYECTFTFDQNNGGVLAAYNETKNAIANAVYENRKNIESITIANARTEKSQTVNIGENVQQAELGKNLQQALLTALGVMGGSDAQSFAKQKTDITVTVRDAGGTDVVYVLTMDMTKVDTLNL